MNAELHEIFPIPIVRYYNVLTNEQLEDIFVFLLSKKNIFEDHGAFDDNGKSTYDHNQNILNLIKENVPSCSNIIHIINDVIVKYNKILGIRDEKISLKNSWCNIQQKDSILKMHTHMNSLFSGAIYINTDENSSKLNFEDFFNHKSFISLPFIIEEYNKFNCRNHWIKPNVGDIILFPSLLMHGSNYEKNQTDNRTVISFNVGIDSEIYLKEHK